MATTASSSVALRLQEVSRSDPRETIRRGSRIVSSRVGIIRYVGHGCYHAQDPVTYSMGIEAGDVSRFTDTENASKGGGASESLANALAATIGEGVERYCMYFYDKKDMILAPYTEVAQQGAVHPGLLRLYSRRQIESLGPDARATYFEESTPIRWVQAYSLTANEPRLVPASLVYMNYRFGDDEEAIGRNASSGLAASLTIEEAILTGLYEVVERDAFTITWLRRKPGRRVEVDAELLTYLEQRFHASNEKVSIDIYDLTLDTEIRTFFVVMKRPAEFGPVVCVGTASRLNPRAAIRKCLVEAGQGIPYFRFLLAQLGDWQPAEDFSDVTSFDHHCIFYLKRPDLVPAAFAFLDESSDANGIGDIPNQETGSVLGDVNRCIELLEKIGLEVIVADITTPDVREVGMHVVRVMVPGMMPLHGVYKYPFLGAKRLPQFPGRDDAALVRPDLINSFPHPFP